MSSAAKDWVLETGPASPTENGEIEVGDKPEGASGNSALCSGPECGSDFKGDVKSSANDGTPVKLNSFLMVKDGTKAFPFSPSDDHRDPLEEDLEASEVSEAPSDVSFPGAADIKVVPTAVCKRKLATLMDVSENSNSSGSSPRASQQRSKTSSPSSPKRPRRTSARVRTTKSDLHLPRQATRTKRRTAKKQALTEGPSSIPPEDKPRNGLPDEKGKNDSVNENSTSLSIRLPPSKLSDDAEGSPGQSTGHRGAETSFPAQQSVKCEGEGEIGHQATVTEPKKFVENDGKEKSLDVVATEAEKTLDAKAKEENDADEQKEIEDVVRSFDYIRENQFLCERTGGKPTRGMECDCTISKEDILEGKKGCGDDCLNRLLMIECNKFCSLGKYCGNKKFQNVENARVEVFKTDWKGFGLRAMEEIEGDEFIMEYVGEVLDARQFRKRAKRFAKDDVRHFYFMALSAEHCIDASFKGNLSRFINHSCDPNAETQKWTVNGELRVGFFSKRKILKGEEVTFDYKYERYGQAAQKCYCGSLNCRGWLGGEPDKENHRLDDNEDEEGDENEDDYWSTSSEEEGEESFMKPIKRSVVKPRTLSRMEKKPTIGKRRKRRSPRKIKNYDNDESLQEMERLMATGIRTKSHTVDICRLMVRSTDVNSRITLANLLQGADAPCRRLFLDYHGLKIIHGWMCEVGWSSKEFDLRIAITDGLSSLPVPHKTMLKETKVLQEVSRWAVANCEADLAISSEQHSRSQSPVSTSLGSTLSNSRTSSPTPVTSGTPTVTTKASDFCDSNRLPSSGSTNEKGSDPIDTSVVPPAIGKMSPDACLPLLSDARTQDSRFDKLEEPLPPGEEEPFPLDIITSQNQVQTIPDESASIKPSSTIASKPDTFLALGESKPSTEIGDRIGNADERDERDTSKDLPYQDEDPFSVARETMSLLVDKVCAQDVEYQARTETAEVMTDSIRPSISTLSKVSVETFGDGKSSDQEETEKKLKIVQTKCQKLLNEWMSLKEVFKIPKRELVKLRVEHEREADRAAENTFQAPRADTATAVLRLQPPVQPAVASTSFSRGRVHIPRPESPPVKQRGRWISRFDDQSGLLHKQNNLSREHRRQLFSLKAETEAKERERRALLQQQHEHKCLYLGLDPSVTPMFKEHPEYYFDHVACDWTPMPPPQPQIEVTWGYPKMAELPLEAFRIDDPPFVDPSFLYPAGVVPVRCQYDDESGDKENVCDSRQGGVHNEGIASAQKSTPPITVNLATSNNTSGLHVLGTDVSSLSGIHETEPEVAGTDSSVSHDTVSTSTPASYARGVPGQTQMEIRLPPLWNFTRDESGRVYFYNIETKESQWDPPELTAEQGQVTAILDSEEQEMIQIETASTDSDSPKDTGNDDEGDTDDEDEDEEEERDEVAMEVLSSDLSAQEKKLLLSRKKTKEERQHERRQKRERDREKREYERKRRRERHGKHRKSGLVTEKFIPKRTEREKMDLMTFREIRERLANRDVIREKQEIEERAEAERELQEERAKRQAERQKEVAPEGTAPPETEAGTTAESSVISGTKSGGNDTTRAAADTSSEVAKKIKDRFRKETSKVIVKVLDPYRRADAVTGRIQSTEDFKHLAKKLTNHIITKELKHNKRIEDLSCSDSVKKKTSEYVRKYMLKFGEVYKRSPQT